LKRCYAFARGVCDFRPKAQSPIAVAELWQATHLPPKENFLVDIMDHPEPKIGRTRQKSGRKRQKIDRLSQFVDRLFHFVDRLFEKVDRLFHFVDRLFEKVDRLFHFVDRLFENVDRLFHFDDRLIQFVDRLFRFLGCQGEISEVKNFIFLILILDIKHHNYQICKI
jgi:hypothetical protein